MQVLAWGSLADVLSSDHFEEELEEAMMEEEEVDRSVTILKEMPERSTRKTPSIWLWPGVFSRGLWVYEPLCLVCVALVALLG